MEIFPCHGHLGCSWFLNIVCKYPCNSYKLKINNPLLLDWDSVGISIEGLWWSEITGVSLGFAVRTEGEKAGERLSISFSFFSVILTIISSISFSVIEEFLSEHYGLHWIISNIKSWIKWCQNSSSPNFCFAINLSQAKNN